MSDKRSSRRQFLRATAGSVIGTTAGIAATSTGAADDGWEEPSAEDFVSGKVEVSAQYGEWQYQISQGGLSSLDNDFPPIEPGSDTDPQRLMAGGHEVLGTVSAGDTHFYTFQAPISKILSFPEPDGQRVLEFDSYVNKTWGGSRSLLRASDNQNFEYGIKFGNESVPIIHYWSGEIPANGVEYKVVTSDEFCTSANFAIPSTGKYIAIKFYPGEEA